MNGAQALFKALIDAGIDTCFANPGTSEMQLVYEMGRVENVRAVLCLEENVVTGAADGYARMAGKPAFTLLHVGSGFANGLANLHNAGRANTAIVNEEFHQQFEAAMRTNGPRLIEAQIVQNLEPVIHAVHNSRR